MMRWGDSQEALRAEGRRLSLDERRPGRRRMDIQERTFQFAVRVVKLVDRLPRTIAGMEVGRQLVRAATSVGANVEEADAAESRRDFVHKMKIAHKEAREARYWLEIVQAALLDDAEVRSLIQESNELICILQAIIKSATKKLDTT